MQILEDFASVSHCGGKGPNICTNINQHYVAT